MLPLFMINGDLGDDVEVGVSLQDRGFTFGDGVFETMRWQNGSLPLLEFHLERLQLGCQRLSIPLSMTKLSGDLQKFIAALESIENAVIKLQVSRGVGGRGYAIDYDVEPSIAISAFESVDYSVQRSKGISLGVCFQPISQNAMLAGIKHCNRLETILLRKEAQEQGFSDALVCDEDGFVIETTMANVFVVQGNKLLTPSLQRSGVNGVVRHLIMERLAAQFEMTVEETKLTLNLVADTEEVFITSSLMGVIPVPEIHLGDQVFSLPDRAMREDSVTRQLQSAVESCYAKAVN